MSNSRGNGIMGSLRGSSANSNGFMNLGRPTTGGFTIHDAFEEEDGPDDAFGCPMPMTGVQIGSNKEEDNAQKPESRQLKYTDDTTSRDSDSLIQEYNSPTGPRNNNLPIYYSTTTSGGSSTNNHTTCWRHPKVRENWRTVLAAFALLFVGTGLVIMGAFSLSETNNTSQGAVFFIAGVICFIPGAYHVVYIWLAARGFRGFDFYHLPLFT